VAMNKPEEIANGIGRAKGNVIALIRGGGDPADFDVFDQKVVIDSWSAKNAYRALGLGHEGTGNTLLHFISDYAASTPSAVGTFLAQRISEMNERKRMTEVLTQRCQTLDEEKRAAQFELSRANDASRLAQLQSAEAAKRDREKLLIIAAFLLGIVFVIGLLLGYRWAP
jgi:exonuclease VII large subunit